MHNRHRKQKNLRGSLAGMAVVPYVCAYETDSRKTADAEGLGVGAGVPGGRPVLPPPYEAPGGGRDFRERHRPRRRAGVYRGRRQDRGRGDIGLCLDEQSFPFYPSGERGFVPGLFRCGPEASVPVFLPAWTAQGAEGGRDA